MYQGGDIFRHTSILTFTFATMLSIIIVLSTCYEYSATAQAVDANLRQGAYQEVIDTAFERLCTSGYVSGISICVKTANNGPFSNDLLKRIRYFGNRARIPHGH